MDRRGFLGAIPAAAVALKGLFSGDVATPVEAPLDELPVVTSPTPGDSVPVAVRWSVIRMRAGCNVFKGDYLRLTRSRSVMKYRGEGVLFGAAMESARRGEIVNVIVGPVHG